jgi:hypothetical protein
MNMIVITENISELRRGEQPTKWAFCVPLLEYRSLSKKDDSERRYESSGIL